MHFLCIHSIWISDPGATFTINISKHEQLSPAGKNQTLTTGLFSSESSSSESDSSVHAPGNCSGFLFLCALKIIQSPYQ